MGEARTQVTVTAEVLEGLEAVRKSGLTNMLDRPRVMELALDFGHVETAFWIEEHPKLYAEGIFFGFAIGEAT